MSEKFYSPARLTPLESRILRPARGLVIIAGVAGSGRSALLRRLAHERDMASEKGVTQAWINDAPEDPALERLAENCVGSFSATQKSAADGRDIIALARKRPDVLLVDELRNGRESEAIIEASLMGHAVYACIHAASLPDAFRRLRLSIPSDRPPSVATDLVYGLKAVMVQHLLPHAIGGGRIAVREYLVPGDDLRRRLVSAHPGEWGRLVQAEMSRPGLTEEMRSPSLATTCSELVARGLVKRADAARILDLSDIREMVA